MRGILTRALRLTTLWILCLAGLYGLSEWVDPVYPRMKARRELARVRATELEAVSLGNSHAGAIDFETLDMKGLHLWNPGGDLHEAAFILGEMLPRLPAARCVMVGLSPYMLAADNAVARRDIRYQIYARTLSLRHLEGDIGHWLGGKLSPVARTDNWKGVLRSFRVPRSEFEIDGLLIRADSIATLPPDSLAQHARSRAMLHRGFATDALAARPETPQRSIARLEEIVGLAAARGIGVVLFTPPYTPAFLDALEPDALPAIRAVAARVARDHPGVEYFDASTDPRFRRSPNFFMDGDHLNRIGARAFSTQLRSRNREHELAHAAGCS